MDIAYIWSEHRECSKDVLERLVEFLSIAEMTKVNECPMQVFFDHLDILFETDVVLYVIFSEAHSDQKCIVKLFVDSQV